MMCNGDKFYDNYVSKVQVTYAHMDYELKGFKEDGKLDKILQGLPKGCLNHSFKKLQ